MTSKAGTDLQELVSIITEGRKIRSTYFNVLDEEVSYCF